LAFGEVNRPDGTSAYFIGLPGNPVSSFITFLVAVRPALLHLQGVRSTEPRAVTLRADFDWPRADKRQEFLRVRLNEQGGLDLFANQSSGVLTSAVWATVSSTTRPARPLREAMRYASSRFPS